MFTYLVENETTTDFVAFRLADKASITALHVAITALVSTQSPGQQLITDHDAVVCASEIGAKVLEISQ